MTWPTVKTYIAPNTRSLLQHLAKSPTVRNNVNLFTISAQADKLQSAVSYMTSRPKSIGALTTSSNNGVQLSVVSFPGSMCRPFRSTIPGVRRAEVGRVRMSRGPTKEDQASEARLKSMLSNGASNWNDALSASGSFELPPQLQGIGNKSSVSSFLYLSDTAPEGLVQSLSHHFPAASQLGLIASSTPFITGRPVTLFKRTDIFADGAVGLALFDQNKKQHDIVFENLQAFSPILEVTQAQTNMVEALDNGNPVEALLRAMNSLGPINKDDDIYLGVIDDETSPVYRKRTRRLPYRRVYKVTAGGPTKGTLLLDTTEGPPVGSKVQFVAVAKTQSPPALPLVNQPTPTIVFNTISDSETGSIGSRDEVQEIDNVFIGTSENGFVVRSSGSVPEGPWICGVPGAKYHVRWEE